MCGEQNVSTIGTLFPIGSSPRVRGTVPRNSYHVVPDRFIPACAGNSTNGSCKYSTPTVHPRVCGEQIRIVRICLVLSGSSPRVRGTAFPRMHDEQIRRFIPACAGNRSERSGETETTAVHPRVCGEQTTMLVLCMGVSGSSPRVRGTVLPPISGLVWAGSSPRVRGTGGLLGPKASCPRFIPACAGNRAWQEQASSPCPVHPRVCGEQISYLSILRHHHGSSPRVRGTVVWLLLLVLRKRFIPACAGNRISSCPQRKTAAVHPRVCGEQRELETQITLRVGSSPRVRGTVVMILA